MRNPHKLIALLFLLAGIGMPHLAVAESRTIALAVPDVRHARIVKRDPLAKFERALAEHRIDLAKSPAGKALWTRTVGELAESTGLDRLRAVHARFNTLRYGRDDRGDPWSSPVAFLRRGVGDCEDYAIAKYAALRDLGVPAEDLSVIVFLDPAIRAAHAALLVRFEGLVYLLDNRRGTIIAADQANFGRLLYAVNERGTSLFVTRFARTNTADGRT